MSVRPDNRLADAPMQPVECEACGAQVLVRKSSWEQTSVQWDADSLARCGRHREARGRTGRHVEAQHQAISLCPQLRESIEVAVRGGTVPVLDEAESL
ncbi:hypothetical protein [Mycobacterium sp. NAZ190054]|uniref:hypothetical protein n=1 Tax=Mycobacterium sp. NAZ190054 TaxID=1747766 RepID=UPI00079B0016|nr:hypothetical protein [Mycobacterium sp. NAZ190054]KWX66312.1 hypothetical protein ASJ79_00750 [Mycobacterium sp. NAZ190054]